MDQQEEHRRCVRCWSVINAPTCKDSKGHDPVNPNGFVAKPGRAVPGFEKGHGSFGEVSPCCATSISGLSILRGQYRFCRKVFNQKEPAKRVIAFEKELKALIAVQGQTRHPHIPLLVCSKGGKEPEIMTYPWCSEKFDVFWKDVGAKCRIQRSFQGIVGPLSCMLSTLVFIHHRRVAHRDVKPQNIRYDQKCFVLLDFGGAKKMDTAEDNSFWYSEPYTCGDDRPSRKQDVFVMGLVFVQALRYALDQKELDVSLYFPTSRKWTPEALAVLGNNFERICAKFPDKTLRAVTSLIGKMVIFDRFKRVSSMNALQELEQLGKSECKCQKFLPRAEEIEDEDIIEEDAIVEPLQGQDRRLMLLNERQRLQSLIADMQQKMAYIDEELCHNQDSDSGNARKMDTGESN
jgi:serine/threonine protein kinase